MHSRGERLLSAQVSWGDKQSVPIKQGQEPPPCSEGAALGNLDFVHLPRLFSAGQEPVSPAVPSLWSVNYSEECFHFLQEKEGPVLWLSLLCQARHFFPACCGRQRKQVLF